MPGWIGSTRKETLPANWEQLRTRRLSFDGYKCQHVRSDSGRKCGARANQVDHVDQERREDHSHENLQSLCQWHHQRKSSAEGGRANGKRATKPRHPGLLA